MSWFEIIVAAVVVWHLFGKVGKVLLKGLIGLRVRAPPPRALPAWMTEHTEVPPDIYAGWDADFESATGLDPRSAVNCMHCGHLTMLKPFRNAGAREYVECEQCKSSYHISWASPTMRLAQEMMRNHEHPGFTVGMYIREAERRLGVLPRCDRCLELRRLGSSRPVLYCTGACANGL